MRKEEKMQSETEGMMKKTEKQESLWVDEERKKKKHQRVNLQASKMYVMKWSLVQEMTNIAT